jgi:hypothetical protein
MQSVGTAGQIQTQNFEEKPSFTANATWIKGNHTFKGGAELYLEAAINGSYAGVSYATGTGPTSQPYTITGSTNSQTMGFGFASFLLGDYSSTLQTPQLNYRQGNQQWALFVQDTWKVTRKLTLDYGLRWDYATTYKEQYGRLGRFDPNTPNANAGGNLGGTIYASTCKCSFYQHPYPYAIGPRIGLAYSINPKTVLRAGFGVNYQFAAASGGGIVSLNGSYPLAGINPFVNIETPGALVQPSWPTTDPSRYPVLGALPSAPSMPDRNSLRPPRVSQWSIGFQRQITGTFSMEAAYVGNVGVWEPSGPLGFFSQISPDKYASFGLYPYPGSGPAGYNYTIPGDTYNATTNTWSICVPGNDCDRVLLSRLPTDSAVIAKMTAAGKASILTPYKGFTGNTLLSTLYPYPQVGAIAPSGSPTGNSMYNSLQIKATKRLTHGLQANGAYTWAKGFTRPFRQDFFNPNSNPWAMQNIPPQVLTFNITYTTPKASFVPKYANEVIKDWQVGFFANYQSGSFLTPPTSPTANFLGSQDIRVKGAPLYLVDINNIHSYNPQQQVVLNPAAWQPCPTNSVCAATSTLYSDFRGPRAPRENANIGRHFRIKERYDLYIRAEFVNIFNRTIFPNPSASNPQIAPTKGAGGGTILTSGFGVINTYQAPGAYPAPTAGAVTLLGRTGTIIARFQF